MDSYHISGESALEGEYRPRGAKNAVLPILAATIASGNTSRIVNCPQLSDIHTMISILENMGCKVLWEGNDILIDSSTLKSSCIPQALMKKIRSSVFLMGPTLARCGEVVLSDPGGCAIGKRPIDIHLNALRFLGVEIEEKSGLLKCKAKSLKGTVIPLSFPSVGATENAMMAALMAEGETVILNPAKEPEIVDLQNYLVSCGAHVKGAGSDRINIVGGKPLHETVYKPIPDRIETGTVLIAAAATKGKVLLRDVRPEHISAVTDRLTEAGCKVLIDNSTIYLETDSTLKAIEPISTEPYPGFPTDMQSQLVALMSIADGTTKITETIFENRFKHVYELNKMGANIVIEGRKAIIKGVENLHGARVAAEDLRGGASLVIAGLAAKGDTIVENVRHIDRGHDKLEDILTALGAKIKRVSV
ncbi:MAG TPA: UDP-N-acetylglucosamine 1-carboxyvinyltransferase [Anaerovoracaceae bacterium]|nr:UDP-N-acetylglucosamine 1-carboxyvinyltransferase [Anaerovoracaceae bacterium]